MKYIVIVDAYSTGKYLAPLFKGNNYSCIHVRSNPKEEHQFDFAYQKNAGNFIQNIDCLVTDEGTGLKAEVQRIAAELRKYDVKAIIPGSEPGVLLADLLNHELKMETANSIEGDLLNARRNKYLMHEELKKKKVNSVNHFKSADEKEIFSWCKSHGKFPVVVKPISSGGSDGVTICHSDADIHVAFKNIKGKSNVLGQTNHEVLVQEFLIGREYVVNTVSYNGKHFVTDIWTSNKTTANSSSVVYDTQDLVDPNDEVFKILETYVKKVLDAVGVRFGAGHSEIMLTNLQNGKKLSGAEIPVLIETGARLAGSIDPSAFTEAAS